MFAQLARNDRTLVLELGLFGWIDAVLLDEVLERTDSMRRVESLAVLDGLLAPVSDVGAESWRLHPLVREHCARQLLRDDPDRFRVVHRRIARALARRGMAVLAMHHATQGGDPFLAGEILEQAGAVRLWMRHGVESLRAANRLLGLDVVNRSPRLKLVRCAALALSGRQADARALYGECPSASELGDAGFEYFVDDCFVRNAMVLYGGDSLGSAWFASLTDDVGALARASRLDPPTRGQFEYALCLLHFLKGDFDLALERLSLARDLLAGTYYVALYGEIVQGQIEFVRGRVRDARACYAKARRIARKHFLLDPVAATSCEIVAQEAALECGSASPPPEPPGLRKVLTTHGVPFSFFATASNVLIDTRLCFRDADQALAVADELLAHVRGAGLAGFTRLLAALRVSVLLTAGRVEDAERAWRREGLPSESAACVDLTIQTWREMEAVAEARVRLLTGRRRFDEARPLVDALRAVAAARGMRRVEMRALALAVSLEEHAGEWDASARRTRDYLRLFVASPYAWPLLRERRTCAPALCRFLGSEPDSGARQAVRSLLAAMRRLDEDMPPSLTDREKEVLRKLPGRRDKQIGAALGLSAHGVRYHLRALFKKLGAKNRAELLQRARDTGLIPDREVRGRPRPQ